METREREGEIERERGREREEREGYMREKERWERVGSTFAVTIFDFIRFTWLINLHISTGLISRTDSQSCLLPLRSHKSCTDQIQL